MSALTLEQQKDLARRMEDGLRFGNAMQALEASQRTEAEKWALTDALMQGVNCERALRLAKESDIEEHGLVLQQRRFMKLRAVR